MAQGTAGLFLKRGQVAPQAKVHLVEGVIPLPPSSFNPYPTKFFWIPGLHGPFLSQSAY